MTPTVREISRGNLGEFIKGLDVECYVLDNGQRVLSQRGASPILGLKSDSGSSFTRLLGSKSISQFIGSALMEKLANPVVFQRKIGGSAKGIDGIDFVALCRAIVSASDAGALKPNQEAMALKVRALLLALGDIAIYTAIDKASRVETTPEKWFELLNRFVQQHTNTLVNEFKNHPEIHRIFYRLWNINEDEYKEKYANNPSFFGRLTNKYVYFPLAQSHGAILEGLKQANPVIKSKSGKTYRMKRFYQYLTEEIGIPALREHFAQLRVIGALSKNKQEFDKNFKKAFGDEWQAEIDFDFDEENGDKK